MPMFRKAEGVGSTVIALVEFWGLDCLICRDFGIRIRALGFLWRGVQNFS